MQTGATGYAEHVPLTRKPTLQRQNSSPTKQSRKIRLEIPNENANEDMIDLAKKENSQSGPTKAALASQIHPNPGFFAMRAFKRNIY